MKYYSSLRQLKAPLIGCFFNKKIIMKLIKETFRITFLIAIIFNMCLAIVFPLIYGMKDSPPLWVAFIIYPLAIVSFAHQNIKKEN